MWDVENKEPFKIIECHRDRIHCIAWNWMGDLIATTCKDKKIRIIDARSGEVLKVGVIFNLDQVRVVMIKDDVTCGCNDVKYPLHN